MKTEKYRYLSARSRVFHICAGTSWGLISLILFLSGLGNRYLLVLSLISSGGLLVSIWAYTQYIYIPAKESDRIYSLFAQGYMMQGIFDRPVIGSPELEAVFKKFEEMIDTSEMISASKKQAEYLALQNQINPHFLYNTLEGIRGETLNAGLDHVAKMTEALATFFRYTISNLDTLVTLEDELRNIENYYIIQQYRFGERLNLEIDYPEDNEEELLKCRMPKLTLQPIVENSIYHGIERKIGKGTLRVKIESTAKRLIITISDDGLGMTSERLLEINQKLHNLSMDYVKQDTETKGGIAVVNVNSRIKLLFGEEYGICIYSVLNLGTDVEITLPLIQEEGVKEWTKY